MPICRRTPSISSSPDTESTAPPSGSTWPAVPFIKTPENSPLLPQEATFVRMAAMDSRKLTPRSAPEGHAPIQISPETMMRMEYDSAGLAQAASGWKPQRPIRPPSPMLETFVAQSPPLRLGQGDVDLTTEPLTVIQLESSNRTKTEDARKDLGKGVKKQKSVGRLNQLFQRKVSEGGSTLKLASTPPVPSMRAVSESGVVLSSSSPTSAAEEFGGIKSSPNSAMIATFPPPKSPRNGGFGKRLLHGLHSRSMSTSDKRELEEVLAMQKKAMGMVSPERPPVPRIPASHSQNLSSRTISESAPSSPALDQTSSPPGSPTARQPTSPNMGSPSPIRRKPVPRAKGDDKLPTSVSSGSLTFGGMGRMGRSTSGGSLQNVIDGKNRG